MLKQAVQKLQSERGASLSMALMLMLVCTVIASVAIAAGSAAGGRLSQVREMSQSYYNVTSAAQLMADELKGDMKVEVVRECDAKRGEDKWTVDPANSWKLTIDGVSIDAANGINGSNATLFELLTCDLLFGTEKYDWDGVNGVRRPELSEEGLKMNMGKARPGPDESDYTNHPYEKSIKVSSSDSHFNDVMLTIKRSSDDTFSFVFSEEPTDSNPSPARYTVVATAQPSTSPDISDTSTHLTWNTTVTWNYLYTVAGDA